MPRQRLNARSAVQLNHARELRGNMTMPQARLWSKLRGDQLGFRFRREHHVGAFIADFACPLLMLIVEVDGDSHLNRAEYDAARTAKLKPLGYRVIRFTDSEVNGNIDRVVEVILQICAS